MHQEMYSENPPPYSQNSTSRFPYVFHYSSGKVLNLNIEIISVYYTREYVLIGLTRITSISINMGKVGHNRRRFGNLTLKIVTDKF